MGSRSETENSPKPQRRRHPSDDLEKGDIEQNHNLVENVAHELRTPLTMILGYAHMLQKGDFGALAPEQAEALSSIVNSSHALWSVIERINAFLSARLRPVGLRALALPDVVQHAIQKYPPMPSQSNSAVEIRADSDLPPVAADPYLIGQAIHCLYDNAVKFSPGGGTILIRLFCQQQWVCCAVQDPGIGIAPDHLDHIFDPFFQVDASDTRRYGGMGVGLSIVKTVIDQHQGEISVSSTPGAGSTFTIRLPIAKTSLVSLASCRKTPKTLL